MLDLIIIEQIKRREQKKNDSDWQPLPLQIEIEVPEYTPQKSDQSSPGLIELDILGSEKDQYSVLGDKKYF